MRPLLAVRHDHCKAWCREHAVPWREDASNAEPWCRRNAVRLEVLPFLRRYNPALDEALAGMADALQADLAYLDGQASVAHGDLVRMDATGIEHLDLAGYRALPEALRRHLLLRWLGPEVKRTHVRAIDDLLRRGQTGAAIVVPGDRRLVRQYDDAVLLERDDPAPLPAVTIAIPGVTVAPAWGLRIVTELLPASTPLPGGRWTVDLDADKVPPPLMMRPRRPGDTMQLPRLAGVKKLQDILVDAKVARRERDRLAVFQGGDGIVWLAGWRVAAWAARNASTERVLRVTALPDRQSQVDGEDACEQSTMVT